MIRWRLSITRHIKSNRVYFAIHFTITKSHSNNQARSVEQIRIMTSSCSGDKRENEQKPSEKQSSKWFFALRTAQISKPILKIITVII